jgi:uncharacterized membrane protein YbhN (UPF0104 family)
MERRLGGRPLTGRHDRNERRQRRRFLTLFSSRADTVRAVSAQERRAGLLDELRLPTGWCSPRAYAAGFVLLTAAGVALGATRIGRGTLVNAVDSLGRAQPGWLVLAAAAFGVGLLCSAAAWRAGLGTCGGKATFTDVTARYAVGSLVNAVAPAHLGGVVRMGLLAQTLEGKDRFWRAGGVASFVAAARTFALAALIVVAALWSRIPLWPAPILAALAVGGVLLCLRLGGRAGGRLGSLLQVFRAFSRCPRAALRLSGWIGLAFVARLAAAAAIAVSLGVHRPVWIAVVLVATMALAGALPLTPGNFGAGAGAVALALHGSGVSLGSALATGVAFQAVETFSGTTLGLAGAATLASPTSPVRRWSVAMAGVGCVLVATALGIMTVDLV